MTPIDKIMQTEPAQWVDAQILSLPDRAKFRAANAIRSLSWASEIYKTGLPIPSAYFALHAVEEAVAAFVSCAKIYSYGSDANINLKDHRQKAVASLIVQTVGILLESWEIGTAVHPESGKIIVRYTANGEVHHRVATTKLIDVLNADGELAADFFDQIEKKFEDTEKLKIEVGWHQNIRNQLIYADKDSLPTGFINPEPELRRACMLTLGLLWASIDIKDHGKDHIPFVEQALRTANIVISQIS